MPPVIGCMILTNQLTSLHLYFLIGKYGYIQALDEELNYDMGAWEIVGFYK